jgi:hypothetical protein
MFWAEREGETCSIYQGFQAVLFVKVADNWTQQMAATLLYDIRANSAVGPYYKI